MTAPAAGRPLGRLPGGRRGRQGLNAEQVSADQRRRLLLAIVEVAAEKGYVATSVADVIARAGVSRATFYEQFSDKQDCFLAAFDAASDLLLATVAGVRRVESPAHLRTLVAEYVGTVVDNPGVARLLLVDIVAAGTEGLQRRAASQQRFADEFARLVGARAAERRFACAAFVAALGSLLTGALAGADDLDPVRELAEPLGRLAVTMLLP